MIDFLRDALAWLGLFFVLLGLFDCYIAWRFVRKPRVDKTAGYLTWWMLT